MRNIKYIGSKPRETAFSDRTGYVWTAGAVHTILDDALAKEMLKFSDVFQDAGDVDVPAIVISTTAPSNADGRQDGTIYLHIAP